jgi:pyruvate-formate lyase-activating enzyme
MYRVTVADELGIRLTRDRLIEHQKLSAQHVTFSVTEACPLRCPHCIVATVPAHDASRTMPLSRAARCADQLPALLPRGVRFISFTGGEPLLASEQVRVLARSANAAKMTCTIVTACHWAGTDAAAQRTVESFGEVDDWHLSTDLFHAAYVPATHIVRAAQAVRAASKHAVVRMAATVPLSAEHRAVYQWLKTSLPEDVDIVVQPVTRMGRARALDLASEETGTVPDFPCVPNAMIVRFDGTIGPCCAGLVDERIEHPFQYGNVDDLGLVGAHIRWCTDPLLQLIRAVGFAPVLQWIRDMRPEHPLVAAVPRHPCECCVSLWRDPDLRVALRQRAEQPANRKKIAELTRVLFGETFMTGAAAACAAAQED